MASVPGARPLSDGRVLEVVAGGLLEGLAQGQQRLLGKVRPHELQANGPASTGQTAGQAHAG